MTATEFLSAAQLVPWAEPNTDAMTAHPPVEALVLAALNGPVPGPMERATPLLRSADTTLCAMPLVDAIVFDTGHPAATCQHCRKNDLRGRAHRLWVPCGESTVEVVCCWFCRNVLDDVCGTLVWR